MSKQEDHNNENLEIDKSIIINASPEVVFKAITMLVGINKLVSRSSYDEPVVAAKVQFNTLRGKNIQSITWIKITSWKVL